MTKDLRFKVNIISVRKSVPNTFINEISKQVQESLKSVGITNYVMGIVGRKTNDTDDDVKFRSLQQTSTVSLASTPVGGKA